MSLSVLVDLGYTSVNLGLADPYVIGQTVVISETNPGTEAITWRCGTANGLCKNYRIET